MKIELKKQPNRKYTLIGEFEIGESKEYEELKSIIAELYRLVDKATEEYKRLG